MIVATNNFLTKYLANIPNDVHLISPSAFGPIQNLKTEYLGSINPRLHSDEILIALSLSAVNNESAKLALRQLPSEKWTVRACQSIFIFN